MCEVARYIIISHLNGSYVSLNLLFTYYDFHMNWLSFNLMLWIQGNIPISINEFLSGYRKSMISSIFQWPWVKFFLKSQSLILVMILLQRIWNKIELWGQHAWREQVSKLKVLNFWTMMFKLQQNEKLQVCFW